MRSTVTEPLASNGPPLTILSQGFLPCDAVSPSLYARHPYFPHYSGLNGFESNAAWVFKGRYRSEGCVTMRGKCPSVSMRSTCSYVRR